MEQCTILIFCYKQEQRDVAIFELNVTLVSALGLISGTMGLFTGFSLLSSIEIVYFLAKFFVLLRLSKKDYQKKSENHLMR